jgi:2-hydroxychromene-2-carboxylate isomerase
MRRLTIYGDFNCPFSALASVRADVLLASGAYEIDWRAVQHDVNIPAAGEPVEGETRDMLASEIRDITALTTSGELLELRVPSVRPNTAAASAAFAAGGQDEALRQRLYAALWSEGRDIGAADELERLGAGGRDHDTAAAWQQEFDALPQPVTPTLVLPDGYVSRGLGALARLAELATSTGTATKDANDGQ